MITPRFPVLPRKNIVTARTDTTGTIAGTTKLRQHRFPDFRPETPQEETP
jgi:hypothetical protein